MPLPPSSHHFSFQSKLKTRLFYTFFCRYCLCRLVLGDWTSSDFWSSLQIFLSNLCLCSCVINYTGQLSAVLSHCPCPALLQSIWSLTVSWSPTKVIFSCILPYSRVCCQTDLQQLWSRCFAAAGPKLWNSLPADLRQADINFQRFKRLLKTFCLVAEIAAHRHYLLKLCLTSFLSYPL